MTTTPPRGAGSSGRAAYASRRSPFAPGKPTVSANVASYIVVTSCQDGSGSGQCECWIGGQRQRRRLHLGFDQQGTKRSDHRDVVGAELGRRHAKGDAGGLATLLGQSPKPAVCRYSAADHEMVNVLVFTGL